MSGWVLATRAADELAPIAAALAARGFEVVAMPLLREAAVDDAEGRAAVERALPTIRMTAFTSKRAPAALRRAAPDLAAELAARPAAAVGEATAAAARRERFAVAVVGQGGGEALAGALAGRLQPGDAVVHPCGREHRAELSDALARAGFEVLPFVVYAMEEIPAGEAPPLPAGRPAAVVLTSPRAVAAYLERSGARWADVPHLAIGATTAAADAAAGVYARPAAQPTTESIVEELCQICS